MKDLTITTIIKSEGRTLLYYYSSIHEMLESAFPNYPWFFGDKVGGKKSVYPRNYWRSIENRVKFLESFEKKLNIRSMEDWYSVSPEYLRKHGGKSLLSSSGGWYGLLQSVFPHYDWDISKIRTSKKSELIGSSENRTRRYILEMKNFFKVEQPYDWFRISKLQLRVLFSSSMLFNNGGLYKLLKEYYRNENWKKEWFSLKRKRSTQRWLHVCCSRLFTFYPLFEDYYHPTIRYSNSKLSIQFDVYIPSLNIAIEYNGEQHYDEMLSGFAPIETYKTRDFEKLQLCKENNINLIYIPYWWNLNAESLHSFVLRQAFSKL